MPTVPRYDNFKVMPNVQPVGAIDLGISAAQATVGARQMMETGEQTMHAGTQYAAVELDALRRANGLRVDGGMNQLKETTLTLRFDPKLGYENLKGLDALQRPDGRSLTDEYGATLEKRRAEIESSLSNDAQKQAFRQSSADLIASFKEKAIQHEAAEFQTYGLSVREGTIKNRQNEIILNYNDPFAVAEAVTSIQAATYDQAQLLGKSAEWAEAQSRDATSKAHALAIQTALQKNNPSYADGYLKKFAHEMNGDDILTVNGSLTTQLDGQIGVDTATQVIQEVGPRITTSPTDRAFNIAINSESGGQHFGGAGSVAGPNEPTTSHAGAIGIAQVMPGTAPEAAKMAGLEWDEAKYKNDPAYNRALGKAYFDTQLKDFNGNLAMAYAAYNAGPGATRDAIKKAEVKGTPQDWVSELPAETQNYVQKNIAAFGAGGGQYEKPTLIDIQNTVRERIGPNQPQRLKIALDEAERQYNSIEKATTQRYEEAKALAMRGVMENGGRFTDLSADVRGALNPTDVTSVMDFAKRVSNGDDTTSLYLYQKLASNPESLADMTDDQFYALRAELSVSDFKHFADERAKRLNGTATNGPGDLNNEVITRTLNDRLNSMGIDPTPENGSSDAERVGAIRRFINQSIAVEQSNRGKKMNDVEISSFMDTLFVQQSGVFSASLLGSPRIAKTGDIPSATKDALKAAFKRQGIDNPTDADLLNAYWRQVSMAQKSKLKKS